jgi:hypothetical protein
MKYSGSFYHDLSFGEEAEEWVKCLFSGKFKVEVKTLQSTSDSLYDEAFINHVQLGRYELTLDHLQEVNPKAALEFVNYMNHETE